MQCPFPIATPMNSIATWDLLTMIELCRDLKFSCHYLVSTAYTPVYSDKEKSCYDIKFLDASVLCRDTRRTLSQHEVLFHARSLLRLKSLCHDRKIPSLRQPLSQHGKSCRDTKPSIASMLCRNMESPYQQHFLSRQRVPCRDNACLVAIEFPSLASLYCDEEKSYRDTLFPSHNVETPVMA